MYRDIVFELPKDTTNLGSSPQCKIQGLYRNGQLLTVQGHPEFNEFTMNCIPDARYQQNVFSDDLYCDGKLRAGLLHDGEVVAAAICRFLLGRTL